jgi:hypothetical protein
MPVGVFLDIQRKTYESDMEEQILKAIDGKKINVDELLIGNSTWEI